MSTLAVVSVCMCMYVCVCMSVCVFVVSRWGGGDLLSTLILNR